MLSSLTVMKEKAQLVQKKVTILGSDCKRNGASSTSSLRRTLSADTFYQKKTALSQELSISETIIAAAYGKYDLYGRTPTSEVMFTMDEISSSVSLIKHDADITDRSESILIGLRKNTLWGNCSHLRVGLASFIVVVGGALFLVLSRGIIRPQCRLYLGIRRPNIDTSHLFALNKLLLIVLAVFHLLIGLAAPQMPFFEWIMDAIILIDLFIPVVRLLYLLLPPLFNYFSPRKNLNRDDETDDISLIEGGLLSDEAVNTELAIQVHDSISDTTNFGKWERGECIGAGGYGIVYVARSRKAGDLCAVKQLKNIHKLENSESIRKEIIILSQLKHPNIVKYFGHDTDEGGYISLYMEYIQSGSLKKYILERGVLHEPVIRNFAAQILSGLAYLHSKRVVQRDIKPDNLLVDSDDIVKLVDFGLSKHLAVSVGKHSELGTPYYAAPEVLKKIEYKSSSEAYAADIWSLGSVIIEMFSGKRPWHNLEPVQAFYNIAVKQQRPPIPEELCQEGKDFLKLCFVRTPADRPSATELQDHPFVKPPILSS